MCPPERRSRGGGRGGGHSIRKGIQVLSTLTFPRLPSFPPLPHNLTGLPPPEVRPAFVCLSTCAMASRSPANQRIPTPVPYTANFTTGPSPPPFPCAHTSYRCFLSRCTHSRRGSRAGMSRLSVMFLRLCSPCLSGSSLCSLILRCFVLVQVCLVFLPAYIFPHYSSCVALTF